MKDQEQIIGGQVCPPERDGAGDGLDALKADDFHPLTTLDDLPTDELEALYELTGIQRADQTSPELHRARKWLSDAVYERHHGPIKRIGIPVPGELQVFITPSESAAQPPSGANADDPKSSNPGDSGD